MSEKVLSAFTSFTLSCSMHNDTLVLTDAKFLFSNTEMGEYGAEDFVVGDVA